MTDSITELLNIAVDRLEREFQTARVPNFETLIESSLSELPHGSQIDRESVRSAVGNELFLVYFQIAKFDRGNTQAIEALRNQFPARQKSVDAAWQQYCEQPARSTSGQGVMVTQLDGETFHAGDQIDNYRLIRLLGQGGMGNVWLAEQSEPMERQVAIKLISSTLAPREWRARFSFELQSLALLQHPNIASVYDAGVAIQGQPYIVMEYIDGVNLIEYCRNHDLAWTDRVRLFVQAAQGVQHAHQRGILHRDLKPQNILVTSQADSVCVKLIDFGLARHIHTAPDAAFNTTRGQVIGTIDYMSPEQASLDSAGIDTRTDIYGLGAVLYELVAEQRPFEECSLSQTKLDQALEVIRNRDPIPPRHRSSSLTMLPKEVDWITLKCLAKEPQRRYDSVASVIDDCRRCIAGDAVLAAPPSRVYAARKFYQRNRTAVLAVAAVAASLVTGLAATGYSLRWALDESQLANKRANDLAETLKQVESAEQQARDRSVELQQVTDFQSNQMSIVNPVSFGAAIRERVLDYLNNSQDLNVSDKASEAAKSQAFLLPVNFSELSIGVMQEQLFAPTEKAIQEQFANQPAVRLQLQSSLASALKEFGASQDTQRISSSLIEEFTKQFGQDDPRTLTVAVQRIDILTMMGELDQAIALGQATAKSIDSVFEPGHPMRQRVCHSLGSAFAAKGNYVESEAQFRKALLELQPDQLKQKQSGISEDNLRQGLSKTLRENGKLAEAETILRELIGRLESSEQGSWSDLANCYAELGLTLQTLGKTQDAKDYLEKSYEQWLQRTGRYHPNTLIIFNNLAAIAVESLDNAETEAMAVENVRRHRVAYGPNHMHTLGAENSLGTYFFQKKNYAKAIETFEGLVPRLETALGADHFFTLSSIANLATNYGNQGSLDKCIELQWKVYRKHSGNHELNQYVRRELFQNLTAAGRNEEAKQLAIEEAAIIEKRFPERNMDRCAELVIPWAWLMQLGQWSAAEPLLRECVEIRLRLARDDWMTYDMRSTLGECLVKLEKFDDAEPHLLEGHRGLLDKFGSIPQNMKGKLGYALDRLVELYDKTGRKSEAAAWQQKLDHFQSQSSSATN
jgi:eukaryotic-like serine/threonine-protein kinase